MLVSNGLSSDCLNVPPFNQWVLSLLKKTPHYQQFEQILFNLDESQDPLDGVAPSLSLALDHSFWAHRATFLMRAMFFTARWVVDSFTHPEPGTPHQRHALSLTLLYSWLNDMDSFVHWSERHHHVQPLKADTAWHWLTTLPGFRPHQPLQISSPMQEQYAYIAILIQRSLSLSDVPSPPVFPSLDLLETQWEYLHLNEALQSSLEDHHATAPLRERPRAQSPGVVQPLSHRGLPPSPIRL